MTNNKNKRKHKWMHRYRMVVLNNDTFEERFSMQLTRLKVFVIITLSSIVLVLLTTLLIAFTPLRELIPGYGSTKLIKDVIALEHQTDSLLHSIKIQQQKYDRIQMVLTGNITTAEYTYIDSIAAANRDTTINIVPPTIKEDSLLRREVDLEDKYNIIENAVQRTNFVFFTPVTGTVSDPFNPQQDHYAVDITTQAQAAIKAAADGTIIYAGWSTETGNTMIIEHPYSVITVYKHMQTLNKKQYEQVQAGEVIGIVGNTGDITTGAHLHFELWIDGYAQDPTNFINFE